MLLAVGLVMGVSLMIRAFVPRRLSAAEAVAALSGTMPSRRSLGADVLAEAIGWMLRVPRIQSWLVPVDPDLAIMGQTAETFIGSLVKRSAVLVMVLVLWGTGIVVPAPVGPAVMLVLGLVAVAVVWLRAIQQLRRAAETRRRSMTNVVQGLLTITMVGATTATPINEVAERAVDHGHGWAYDLLRSTFRQGTASNLKIYESLSILADRIGSRSLHLFADSIRSGDREALALSSVAQRSHTLQTELATHIVARAEEHRRTLQLPIATFAITVVLITVVIPLMTSL
ncbi:MAG: hypothetical protein ACFCVK_20470 [Acidimicrobiales bacterium]